MPRCLLGVDEVNTNEKDDLQSLVWVDHLSFNLFGTVQDTMQLELQNRFHQVIESPHNYLNSKLGVSS